MFATLLLLSCAHSAKPVEAAPAPVAVAAPAAPALPPLPAAPPGTTVDTIQGVPVADPYRWLEDEKAPAVQSWMTAEDAHARALLHGLPARDSLAKRFKELYYVDSVSAP